MTDKKNPLISYVLTVYKRCQISSETFRFSEDYPNLAMNYIYSSIQKRFKFLRNKLLAQRLKNRNFTIITNHCMGGFIYHDLRLQFLSPTINLKILPDDFVEMAEHLEYYMSQPVQKALIDGVPYPTGKIKKLGGEKMSMSIFILYITSPLKMARINGRGGLSASIGIISFL